MMKLISKVLAVLSVLMAAVLFAGAYDVFHLGLKDMMGSLAIVPIGLFLLTGLAHPFLAPKPAVAGDEESEALSAKIDTVQSKVASKVAELQSTIDELSGKDNKALMEENAALREQLEAIHQAARDKVEAEANALKSRNEELEEQIKKWAVKTVGDAVSGDQAEAA